MVVSHAANTINLAVGEILADQGKEGKDNNNNNKDNNKDNNNNRDNNINNNKDNNIINKNKDFSEKKFTLLDDAADHCLMKKEDCWCWCTWEIKKNADEPEKVDKLIISDFDGDLRKPVDFECSEGGFILQLIIEKVKDETIETCQHWARQA